MARKWHDLVGREYTGKVPCWDAVRDFYRQELGRDLPDYAAMLAGRSSAQRIRAALESFEKVDEPEFGDLVLIWARDPKEPVHVGAIIDQGKMFHAAQGAGKIADLTSPVWSRHVEGYYRHRPVTWRLVCWPHPLRDERIAIDVPVGKTIGAALRDAGMRRFQGAELLTLVGSDPISAEWLERCRPKPGVLVSVRPVPGELVSILFAIASVVAAAVPGAAAVGSAAASLFFGSVTTASVVFGSAAAASAATAAAVGTIAGGALIVGGFVGGLFALSTLFTPPEVKGAQAVGPAASPSANGVGNAIRRFEPVPIILGRMRSFPPLYALPFTSSAGRKRFWNIGLLVSAVRCKIDFTDELGRTGIEVGGIPIEDIPGAEWEIIQGGIASLSFADEALRGGQSPGEQATDFWPLSASTANDAGARVLIANGSPVFGGEPIIERSLVGAATLDGVDDELVVLTGLVGSEEWTFLVTLDLTGLSAADVGKTVIEIGTGNDSIRLDVKTGGGQGLGALNGLDLVVPPGSAPIDSDFVIFNNQKPRVWKIARRGNDLILTAESFVTTTLNGFFLTRSNPALILIGARSVSGVTEGHVALRAGMAAWFESALSVDRMSELDAIADAPISTIQRRGRQPRLLADTVEEIQVNHRFETPDDELGDFVAQPWKSVAFSGDSEEISLDFFFQTGIFRVEIDDSGADNKSAAIGIQVELREKGATEWISAIDFWTGNLDNSDITLIRPFTPTRDWGVGDPGSATPDGKRAFILGGTITREILTGTTFRVPRGKYECRVRSFTMTKARFRGGESDKPLESTSFEWLSARAIRVGEPPLGPGTESMALVNLRLPIEEVGSSVSSISVLAESMFRERVGGAWTEERPTRNAAALALGVLQHPSITARPVPDSSLNFTEWDAFASRALPTDMVVDFATNTFDLANLLLSASFASLRQRATIGVVEDRAGLDPDQLITSRDMQGFTWSQRFDPVPDGARVTFQDADNGYQDVEILVFRDGVTAETAKTFTSFNLRGTTDRTRAIERAKKLMRMAELRTTEFSGVVFLSHLNTSRGGMVLFQNQAALIGLRSARVIATTTNGNGDITSVKLDEEISFPAGIGSVGTTWRRAISGGVVIESASAQLPVGVSDTLTFEAPVDASTGPVVGTLISVGEPNKETIPCLVREMTHFEVGGAPAARIVLIPYEEQVHNAVDDPIVFAPVVTLPGGIPSQDVPAVPRVVAITSDETVLVDVFGVLQPRLRIVLAAGNGRGGTPDVFRVRVRPLGGAEWQIETVSGFPPVATVSGVAEGVEYEIQAQALTRLGIPSAWSPVIRHVVVGGRTPPPNIDTLRREGDELVWERPPGIPDIAGYELRIVSSGDLSRVGFGSALPLHSGLWTPTRFPVASLPAGKSAVLLVAVDRGGRRSQVPARLFIELDTPGRNVVTLRSERDLGWPGMVTGGAIVGGSLVANVTSGDDSQPGWLEDDSQPAWLPDDSFLDDGAMSSEMVYAFDTQTDPRDVGIPERIRADIDGGNGSRLSYRVLGPAPAWPLADGELEPDDDGLPGWTQPEWSPWFTRSFALPFAATTLRQVRVEVFESLRPATVVDVTTELDVPDRREVFENVPISAEGSRLPVSSLFREVQVVLATREQLPGDTSVRVEVVDKQPIGPMVRVLDGAGDPVASNAWDFEVIGF